MKFIYESSIKTEYLIHVFERFPLLLKITPPQYNYKILDESTGLVNQSIYVKTLNREISFDSIFKKIDHNSFSIKIISGQLKGSETRIKFISNDEQTKIYVEINLQLGFKFKIFSSILNNKIKTTNISLFQRLEKFIDLLFNNKYEVSFENNYEILVIDLKDKKLFFSGWWLGDIWSSFIGNTYEKIPFENKQILDIGSNIADTAISFIYKGAKKVIAFEPFPINYEFAKLNILKNNMNEKIINIHGGCSGKSSNIIIDSNLSGLGYQMKETENGIKIKQFSLKEIVEKFNIFSGIIKMNCEGCEYDSIINSSNEVLRKFSHILIQYHDGFDLLKQKLDDAGFIVIIDEYSQNKGQLFAEIK